MDGTLEQARGGPVGQGFGLASLVSSLPLGFRAVLTQLDKFAFSLRNVGLIQPIR